MSVEELPGVTRIYPAFPNPALDRALFYRRWRAHAELAQKLPVWSTMLDYKQLTVIDASGPNRGECAGVCIASIGNEQRLSDLKSDTRSARILADEWEVFARPIDEVAINATSYVRSWAAGPIALIVMAFCSRKYDQEHSTDSEPSALTDAAASRADISGMTRLVEHVAFPPTDGRGPGWDRVLEIGFSTRDAASAFRAVQSLTSQAELIPRLILNVEPDPVYHVEPARHVR